MSMSYSFDDKFYNTDKQLGDYVSADDVNLYSYCNADLISMYPEPFEPDSVWKKKPGGSEINVFKFSEGTSKLRASFYVGGTSKTDMLINVNKLLSKVKDCTIKTSQDDFERDCLLSSFNISDTTIEWFSMVEVEWISICRLPLVTVETSGLTYIDVNNVGTVDTGIRIEVVSASNAQNVQMLVKDNRIMFKELHQNEPFIIDGIEGKVLRGAEGSQVNGFLLTDFVEFPKVPSGKTRITFSRSLSVKASFYPVFGL